MDVRKDLNKNGFAVFEKGPIYIGIRKSNGKTIAVGSKDNIEKLMTYWTKYNLHPYYFERGERIRYFDLIFQEFVNAI
jgi:hypothetical protein